MKLNRQESADTFINVAQEKEMVPLDFQEKAEFLPGSQSGSQSGSHPIREYAAEFLGTLVLVMCGDGVIAQAAFNQAAYGSGYLSINLGWGAALFCAILLASQKSQAHLNPAITIALSIFGKFPLAKALCYVMSQFLGAFVGAALVFLIYWPSITAFDGGVRATTGPTATAGIFATYPQPNIPAGICFSAELIATCFLVLSILCLTSKKLQLPSWGVAMGAAVTITSIGLSLGFLTGYALNPARDLAPRLFTLMAGYGSEPFTAGACYFLIPVVAPVMGAILANLIHDFIISP